jgi:hypothetical protein
MQKYTEPIMLLSFYFIFILHMKTSLFFFIRYFSLGKGQNIKNQNVESQREHQKFGKDQNIKSQREHQKFEKDQKVKSQIRLLTF